MFDDINLKDGLTLRMKRAYILVVAAYLPLVFQQWT
jgi:hypothetical protein